MSTGFSFGKPAAPAAAPAAGGFKFAAAPTAAAPAAGGFSFGAKPAGAAAPAAPAAGGFSFAKPAAAGAAPAAGAFSFGKPAVAGAAGGFSFAKPGLGAAAPAAAPAIATAGTPLPSGAIPGVSYHNPPVSDPLIDKINTISKALDLASPHCRFQCVLYNRVNPAFLAQIVKPPHANADVWAKGVAANPDPSHLAPCLVVGFSDLERRVAEQHKAVQAHLDVLAATSDRLDEMQQTQQAHTAELDRLKTSSTALAQRLLRLANQADLLRARGVPLVPTETDLRRKLERIEAEIVRPGALQDRVADIAARADALRLHDDDGGDAAAVAAAAAAAAAARAGGSAPALAATALAAAAQVLDAQRMQVEELVGETALIKADVEVARRVLDAQR
jgi:nuclear pore complex protein Nup54